MKRPRYGDGTALVRRSSRFSAYQGGDHTTRHAASLRPSRNGRIGFKPPYSKREPVAKDP